jgi:hypothetical protein
MAQYDIPFLQATAAAKYDFVTVNATAGGILGFNPTTRVPQICTAFTYDSSGHIQMVDGKNIKSNAGTGTSLGSAVTEKVSVYGVTPIVQRSGANQAALTDSTTGVAAFTLVDAGAAYSQANVNANFASIARLLNQLRSDLVAFGVIKGSA